MINDRIWGWKFKAPKYPQPIKAPYIPPTNDDGAFAIASNFYGYNVHTLNLEQTFDDDIELIRKYREISLQPEVDLAINELVNEAIIGDNTSVPVDIVLDDLDQPDTIKDKIREEFEHILKLLDFNSEAYEIFRKWYVDGRIFYHIVIDNDNPADGIQELRYISSIYIKKIREEVSRTGPDSVPYLEKVDEYYMYSREIHKTKQSGLKLAADSVVMVNSGLIDDDVNMVYSYLHKAIKNVNQLRMIEDAIIIYRLSRAPERRVFYIDTGNLPKNQAEQYLRNISTKYKNQMVYDTETGEIKDASKTLSMMEDFWLPRREGGKGTEVTTLAGAQNLGAIEDLVYFKKKLYLALNVPYNRVAADEGGQVFQLGRPGEITRDEVRFSKFISRLRKRFSALFYELLKTQLLLKNIITREEWEEFKEDIAFDFIADTYFVELKEAEILKERANTFASVSEYIEMFFSREWAAKTIWKLTDEDIEQLKKQRDEEGKQDLEDGGPPGGEGSPFSDDKDDQDGGGNGKPFGNKNNKFKKKEPAKEFPFPRNNK